MHQRFILHLILFICSLQVKGHAVLMVFIDITSWKFQVFTNKTEVLFVSKVF